MRKAATSVGPHDGNVVKLFPTAVSETFCLDGGRKQVLFMSLGETLHLP